MKIFMLGWEFPPFIAGGLGTACYGLTRALDALGHHVTFVLPRAVPTAQTTHVSLRAPDKSKDSWPRPHEPISAPGFENVRFHVVPSTLRPYASPGPGEVVAERGEASQQSAVTAGGMRRSTSVLDSPKEHSSGPGPGPGPASGPGGHYSGDMFADVERYTAIAVELARTETFDVIHAHDWMTYPAGLAVAAISGKPLVVHVHSTEFDRSGEHVHPRIYEIERRGVHGADRAIAVSYLTRNILLTRYSAPPEKVNVVYNAIGNGHAAGPPPPAIGRNEKIVLFLGRITMQKGPEFFLAAAKKVLEYEKDVRFIMAGSGDLVARSIELAAEMGIGHKVLFTGFLRGDDVARVFKMADLYVMPSVSEPFGIAPLEALSHDVPVLISKQSGVSEILRHALKADFWDVNEMANKIIAVLRHPPLQTTLRERGAFEIKKLTWADSAQQCVQVYETAMRAAS